MSKRLKDMSDEEFGHTVTRLAHAFAARDYQRENPLATEDEAWAHSSRCWRRWVDRALTCLAALEALREAEDAAPSN